MAAQSDLKNYQRSLDEDQEEKRRFADVEEDTESESESEEAIKIVPPKKAKKRSQIDTMLMEQLIAQQKAYLKAQKTIYKLRTEIDTEEVKTRYVKLDLNNAEVRITELTANAEVRITELTAAKQEIQNRFYKVIADR